jgi:16S rRNA (cytosine967-C5)-methyltransferase
MVKGDPMRAPVIKQCYDLLRRVDQGAYSDRIMQSALATQRKWNHEDRAFLTSSVRGVLENQRLLDWHITQLVKKAPRGRVRAAMRLGIYLLITGRAPHAVLSELLTALSFLPQQERAMLNAILREQAKGELSLDTADLPEDQKIQLKHSMPPWLPGLFKRLLGEKPSAQDLDRMMGEWRKERALWFRVNPQMWSPAKALKVLDSLGLEPKVSEESDYFITLNKVPKDGLHQFSPLQKGALRIQDLSTLGAVSLLDIPKGEQVLDLCAAPGGKTLALLDRLPRMNLLVVDRDLGRVESMKRRLPAEVKVVHGDVLEADLPMAAAILLDAPCSGTGSAAHRPEIFLRDENPLTEELIQLQAALLDRSAALTLPGGCLVYSTCSLDPRENMLQITAFLERHQDFALEPCPVPDAFQGMNGAFFALPFTISGIHSLLPTGRPGASGAFAIRLRKRGSM